MHTAASCRAPSHSRLEDGYSLVLYGGKGQVSILLHQIPRTWNACPQLSWTNLYNPRGSLRSKTGLTILAPFIRKQSVSQGKLAQTIALDSSSDVCLRRTPGSGLTTVNCIVIDNGWRRFLAQTADVAMTRRRGRIGHECVARTTANKMCRCAREAEE